MNDWRDGIKEGKPLAACGAHDAARERLGGQRAGCDDGETGFGQGVHPLAYDGDIRVLR